MSPAAKRKAAPADLSLLGTPEPLPEAVVRQDQGRDIAGVPR